MRKKLARRRFFLYRGFMMRATLLAVWMFVWPLSGCVNLPPPAHLDKNHVAHPDAPAAPSLELTVLQGSHATPASPPKPKDTANPHQDHHHHHHSTSAPSTTP